MIQYILIQDFFKYQVVCEIILQHTITCKLFTYYTHKFISYIYWVDTSLTFSKIKMSLLSSKDIACVNSQQSVILSLLNAIFNLNDICYSNIEKIYYLIYYILDLGKFTVRK